MAPFQQEMLASRLKPDCVKGASTDESFLLLKQKLAHTITMASHSQDPYSPIHFYILILKTYLQTMMIPSKFTVRYGRCLSNPVCLKTPDGREWKVYWSKRDNEFWFQEGWEEFANFYSLDEGYLVLFKYEGTSQLDVHIIDKSALEIDYPLSMDASDQEDTLDNLSDDDSIEILDEMPPITKANHSTPFSSCSWPHKKMRSTKEEDVEMRSFDLQNMSVGMKTEGKQFQGTELQKSTDEDLKFWNLKVNSSEKEQNSSMKDPSLEEASSFQRENPNFTVTQAHIHSTSYMDMRASGQPCSGRDDNNINTSTNKKRGRGAIRLKELTLRDKTRNPQRIRMEFDEDLDPIGEEGTRFISYVGLMVRSSISIEYPNWKSVKPDLKEKFWEDILLTYDIPATKEMKKHLFRQASKRWRGFKSMLTKEYIGGPRKGEHPKERYPFITEEVWEKFKKSREDPKFQELSTKHKEISAKNIYPHYMSRLGYKGLEKMMMKAQLKAAQEAAASDPNIIVPPLQHPSRHQKWKAARIKEGNYINPKVATIAKKIDQLEEQVSQGSFSPSGRMDILATAIGKPDQPGRVRGVGKNVGLKQYFGATSRRSSSSMVSKDELDERIKKETEEIRAHLHEEHERECNKLREEFMSKLEEMMDRGFQVSRATEQFQVPKKEQE